MGAEEPVYSPRTNPVEFEDDRIHPLLPSNAAPLEDSADTYMEGALEEHSEYEPDAHTSLLHSYNQGSACGKKRCNHGTFSPRPEMHRKAMSYDSQFDFGSRQESIAKDTAVDNSNPGRGIFGAAVAEGTFGMNSTKKMSTTQWLAKRHGVKDTRLMYVVFYLGVTALLPIIPALDVTALINCVWLSGISRTIFPS